MTEFSRTMSHQEPAELHLLPPCDAPPMTEKGAVKYHALSRTNGLAAMP